MAELTVDYTYGNRPVGKFTLSFRGNGYEWKTSGQDKIIEYVPQIGKISLILLKNSSLFRGHFTNPYDFKPLMFSEEDAMKLYNMMIEHIQWSPESMVAGTAHPNLMAAKENFSKARKTRKSRK